MRVPCGSARVSRGSPRGFHARSAGPPGWVLVTRVGPLCRLQLCDFILTQLDNLEWKAAEQGNSGDTTVAGCTEAGMPPSSFPLPVLYLKDTGYTERNRPAPIEQETAVLSNDRASGAFPQGAP